MHAKSFDFHLKNVIFYNRIPSPHVLFLYFCPLIYSSPLGAVRGGAGAIYTRWRGRVSSIPPVAQDGGGREQVDRRPAGPRLSRPRGLHQPPLPARHLSLQDQYGDSHRYSIIVDKLHLNLRQFFREISVLTTLC
jgi:hypothetical protein